MKRAFERLIAYTAYETASDEASETCPSTPAQTAFARALADELAALGVKNARADGNGYVYGTIPANIPGWRGKTVGFIAHMDVSPDAPSENVSVMVAENYDGGVIRRPGGDLDPADAPELLRYVGRTVICSDGRTLLGADDKAGVAEIVTFCEFCAEHPEFRHGEIAVAFTPDEEIGRGADRFDVAGFGADFAFTCDGGAVGEVEYETFNAAAAKVRVTGVSIHPGSAKGRMINAARAALAFDAALPADERPETTEGRQGFFHLTGMSGGVEEAELDYILRDHDAAAFEARKRAVRELADRLNGAYGRPVFSVEIRDQYRNMAEVVLARPEILELARSALRGLGREPFSVPVRGGTDGSRLSFMGLPCPNLGTGSHGHHGRGEFAVAEEMDLAVRVLAAVAENAAK